MATVETRRLTADEFFDWANQPENQDRFFELVKGEVIELPPPGEKHGFLCSWISHLLWGYVLRRGSGYICTNDTGLLVEQGPDSVRGPDVMVFAESRPLDQLSQRFVTRIPQLIVEVLSPSDQMHKVIVRVNQYLLRGVPAVWIVSPETRTVSVHRRAELPQVCDDSEELDGGEVLPGFRCRVAELFELPGQAASPSSGGNNGT